MIKVSAFLTRRPDLTHEQFSESAAYGTTAPDHVLAFRHGAIRRFMA